MLVKSCLAFFILRTGKGIALIRASRPWRRTIMHMADALISPAVGGAMWVATAGLTVYSARKLKEEIDERKIPLMGVLGALVFAAQMINFTIPGTGSSGHLGGGLLLAVLLGPYAAFLTMASILTIQALFFRGRGPACPWLQYLQHGVFPLFRCFPLDLQKNCRKQPGAETNTCGRHGRLNYRPSIGGFRGCNGDGFFRYLRSAFQDFRIADASHTPGDRHCRGLRYGLCCRFCKQDPPRSSRNGNRTLQAANKSRSNPY